MNAYAGMYPPLVKLRVNFSVLVFKNVLTNDVNTGYVMSACFFFTLPCGTPSYTDLTKDTQQYRKILNNELC